MLKSLSAVCERSGAQIVAADAVHSKENVAVAGGDSRQVHAVILQDTSEGSKGGEMKN